MPIHARKPRKVELRFHDMSAEISKISSEKQGCIYVFYSNDSCLVTQTILLNQHKYQHQTV